MTWVRVYVVAYVVLILAAAGVLWEAGLLARIPAAWTVLVLAAALSLGILLVVVSGGARLAIDPPRD
jgi:hypothetical protein